MRSLVDVNAIHPLIHGYHENPFEVLGPHEIEDNGRRALAVRAFLPPSQQAWLVDPREGQAKPMRRIHPAGLFEAICPPEIHNVDEGRTYQLRAVDSSGEQVTMHDPYAFPPLLTDYDLHLLGEGRHWRSYEKLGAHLRTVDGVAGVNFAVWAPNAESVSVVGDFNGWDGRQHAMRKHIPSGVWELFIPGLPAGTIYKYLREEPRRPRRREVRSLRLRRRAAAAHGHQRRRPGRTTTGTTTTGWPAGRRPNRLDAPMSIYEVHLGSWQKDYSGGGRRWLNYRELAHQLVDYCQQDGLHAPRADAGQRASVHRQLGLSDGRLLRRHQPLRHARRLHVLRRSLPPERHRRDPRLGAGPLPQGRPRPATASTARPSTSTPTPARASIPTGAR